MEPGVPDKRFLYKKVPRSRRFHAADSPFNLEQAHGQAAFDSHVTSLCELIELDLLKIQEIEERNFSHRKDWYVHRKRSRRSQANRIVLAVWAPDHPLALVVNADSTGEENK